MDNKNWTDVIWQQLQPEENTPVTLADQVNTIIILIILEMLGIWLCHLKSDLEYTGSWRQISNFQTMLGYWRVMCCMVTVAAGRDQSNPLQKKDWDLSMVLSQSHQECNSRQPGSCRKYCLDSRWKAKILAGKQKSWLVSKNPGWEAKILVAKILTWSYHESPQDSRWEANSQWPLKSWQDPAGNVTKIRSEKRNSWLVSLLGILVRFWSCCHKFSLEPLSIK